MGEKTDKPQMLNYSFNFFFFTGILNTNALKPQKDVGSGRWSAPLEKPGRRNHMQISLWGWGGQWRRGKGGRGG